MQESKEKMAQQNVDGASFNICQRKNKKSRFYSMKIEEYGRDKKKLFRVTRNLMGNDANVNSC